MPARVPRDVVVVVAVAVVAVAAVAEFERCWESLCFEIDQRNQRALRSFPDLTNGQNEFFTLKN